MPVFSIIVDGKSGKNTIYKSDENISMSEYGDAIISPKIKKETNKADSFEFMIIPNHAYYDEFEKKKTFVYITRDTKTIFRGRVSDVKTDIYRQRTITCEGDLAYLADSVQAPNKETKTENAGNTKKKKRNTLYYASGHNEGHETGQSSKDTIKMTVETYFRRLIDVHNGQMNTTGENQKTFTVGQVTVSDRNKTETFERTSYQDTGSVINSDLLSVYGGVLRTRYENNTAYIDWLEEYTDTQNQEIRFGVNMIDLDMEPPNDDTWSVLLPIGEENVTIADANNGSKYLISNTALAKYGYIVHYHKFSNVKKPSELLSKAQTYLATHAKVFPDNFVVKAIDLQLIGESNYPLELGERIKVYSEPHGINETMACIAMELDIQNPENNSYTIGTIMPPDKEKKREALSEKHSSSRRSSSRGVNQNQTSIEALQGDMDAVSNNVNVNAENIALNALNIAVNAENIAVVAKNIAIAADTIDIKAQEITRTFGEESDELYGYIQETAEGIKTHFTNKTSGLSTDISVEAGKIVSEISNANTSMSSKIEQTESSITATVNDTAQGLESQIQITAQGIFAKVYGRGADPDDPNTWTQESLFAITRNKIFAKVYGEGGNPDDPGTWTRGSIFQITRDSVYAQVYGTNADPTDSSTWSSASIFSITKDSVFAKVYGQGSNPDDPSTWSASSSFGITRDGISSKVSKDGVISSINQTSESIRIRAEKINLDGYVTMQTFSATSGKLENLMTGSEVATKIVATSMKAVSSFEIGDQNNNGVLKYRNTEYYACTVSMPGAVSSFTALGLSYYNGGYQTSLSLAHSHSVTTNSDGTITIGGSVSTTATGRSFRIADTKAYKDGVSAAINSVTVDSVGLNTTDYPSSGVGDSSSWTGVMYYVASSANHDTHVRIRADASNGKHREANITVPGNKAYDAGYNAVYVSSLARTTRSDGTTYEDTWNSSGRTYTVHTKAILSNNAAKSVNFTVDASDAYDAGYNAVYVSSLARNTYSDGTTYGDIWNSYYKTYTVHAKAILSNDATRSANFTVDASDAYDAGWDAVSVKSSSEGGVSITSYTPVTWNEYSTKKEYANLTLQVALTNGKTVSRTIEKQSFTAIYDNGWNDVNLTYLGRDPSTNDRYSSSTHDTTITIKATAGNGKVETRELTISGTNAYNTGLDTGYQTAYYNAWKYGSITEVTVYSDGTADATLRLWDTYNGQYETFSKPVDVVRDYHNPS